MNAHTAPAPRPLRRLTTHVRVAALLTQGEASACLRGIEGEAVSHYGGRAAVLRDAIAGRHRRIRAHQRCAVTFYACNAPSPYL